MVGIYIITSPTNKIYVGQSWDIAGRKRSYKGLFCKKQKRLYNSLMKHGWEAHKFEVILELREDTTQEWLDYWETFFWNYYKENEVGILNIKKPGSRGKFSEESKKKLSIARMGENNPMFGGNFSEEHRRKMSESQLKRNREPGYIHPKKGKPNSPEANEKTAAANRGRVSPMKGRKHSEESRRKISNSNIGRKRGPLTEEHKQRLRGLRTGMDSWNKKLLYNSHYRVNLLENGDQPIKRSRL